MKKILYLIFLLITIYSCKPNDEIITTDNSAKLRFSTDTIQFDTLLTTIGSVSKKVKIYNDSKNAVIISKIELKNGENSVFELIINGKISQRVNDIQLLGKDSLLVIVKANLGDNNENGPYVLRDALILEVNSNIQNVKLEAWGRDAHFIKNGELICNTTWINDKAYVISDSIIIPQDCELVIEKGCHILFKYNAKLIVKGSLKIIGDKNDFVRFFNDNDLSEVKEEALGYWRGIIFTETSKNNTLEYTHIENAFNGIYCEENTIDSIADITLKNVQISNMLNTAITSKGNDIIGQNCLLSNSVANLLKVEKSGNYHFTHCTFAHLGSGNKKEAISLVGDGKLTCINSIIWGNKKEEFTTDNFQLYLNKNLLKTQQNIENNILNTNPLFVNQIILNYELDSLSKAINEGIQTSILDDLNGNQRDNTPDIGAFEFIKK